MKKTKLYLVTLLFIAISCFTYAQNPTAPALGFNIFVENNVELIDNESEGGVAAGGDLIMNGNYRVNIYDCGNFTVGGLKVGLVINGKVDFGNSNGQVSVNMNRYAKIGDATGSTIWYLDPNNAPSPIRISEANNYNSVNRVNFSATSPILGNVSATNNPITQSNVIDFATAFQTMRASAITMSQNAHNAVLIGNSGQPIPNTNLPSQLKSNLQNGVNYFNITGADLNSVSNFIFDNSISWYTKKT